MTTPTLLAYTVVLPAGSEPLALLTLPGARDGDRAFWSAFDDDVAIAGIGAAHVTTAAGPDRLANIAGQVAAARERLAVGGEGMATAVWLGGFAFAPESPAGPWAAFGAARFVLPETLVVRRGAATHLTTIGFAEDSDAVATRARGLAAQLASAPSPSSSSGHRAMEGAASSGALSATSAGGEPWRLEELAAPGSETHDFTAPGSADLVARLSAAISALGRGEAEKVVLGTTRTIPLASPPDPARLVAGMAASAPGCTRFLVAPTAGSALIGATPERLVAVEGRRLRTMALAGTAPRGTNAAGDDALGRALLASAKDRAEHAHVVEAIRQDLAGAKLSPPTEPRLRRLATMQHLETPIDARLARRGDVLVEAARLHPTPALGGRPRERALALIAQLELEPRGWFGGAVGWLDGRGDGDLAVVIRSLLLHGNLATAFAGAGLVDGSNAAAEAREIALKLRAAFAPVAGLAAPAGAAIGGPA